jgi:hypothetical protein
MTLRIMTILLACIVLNPTPVNGDGPKPNEQGHKDDFRPQPGIPYFALDIPDTIGRADFQRYQRRLTLSEAQSAILFQLYDRYRTADREYRWEKVAPLFDRAADVAKTNDVAINLQTAAKAVELLRSRDAVVDQLTKLENALFNDLKPMLSEYQQGRLEFVKMDRQRARSRTVPCWYAGARYDLSNMVMDWREEEALNFNDQNLLAVLDDYDRAATRLWRDHSKTLQDWNAEELILSATAMSAKSSDIDEKYYRRRIEMNARISKIDRRIHDLNATTLRTLEAVLPIPVLAELREAFETKAYPPVFPSPYVVDPIIDTVERISDLSELQRNAVTEIVGHYRTGVESITDAMKNTYLARIDHYNIDRAYKEDELNAYMADMTALQSQRRENAEKTVDALMTLLTPDQSNSVQKMVASFHKAVAAHQPSRLGIDFRP